MKENKYSENNRAKNLLGLRGEELKSNNVIPINLPWELGYVCPICKKPGELLAWSEYNSFLYCFNCNIDIPSCLCVPIDHKKNKTQSKYKYDGLIDAIKVFLDTIEILLEKTRKDENPFCSACKEKYCVISLDGTCEMIRNYLNYIKEP